MKNRSYFKRLIARVVCCSLLVAAAVLARAETATAQSLFVAASSADAAALGRDAGPSSPQSVRQRLVRIDQGVLASHVVSAGGIAAAEKLDGVVRLDLFPDAGVTLRRTNISEGPSGGYVWEGAHESDPLHEALLVIKNGRKSQHPQRPE